MALTQSKDIVATNVTNHHFSNVIEKYISEDLLSSKAVVNIAATNMLIN
tara:strand:+ start:231 stop:377 length:147 start_codon:yes stop_codon:yes gene_type:complete